MKRDKMLPPFFVNWAIFFGTEINNSVLRENKSIRCLAQRHLHLVLLRWEHEELGVQLSRLQNFSPSGEICKPARHSQLPTCQALIRAWRPLAAPRLGVEF